MTSLEKLKGEGWYLSPEGVDFLTQNGAISNTKEVINSALNMDIKEIGAPIINTEIIKEKFGPAVLQVQKLRNISAPKSNEESQAAPRMLKISLTDGHSSCQAIEITNISSLGTNKTPPGTKLLIKGAPVVSGSLLIYPECCKVLGGLVQALVEKWEMTRKLPKHIRELGDGGPPPWVTFGKKVITSDGNESFKSLSAKEKESKENAEFEEQRKDAIAEASVGAVKKVFGGGARSQPANFHESGRSQQNTVYRNPRPVKTKRNEKDERPQKPAEKVSLFHFLEDKLPVENAPPITPVNFAPQPSSRDQQYVNNFHTGRRQDTDDKYNKPPRFRNDRKPENFNSVVDNFAAMSLSNNVKSDISSSSETWKWNVGDKCLAKYWEDNKYYNATVTDVTKRTCVVDFDDYGNFEEVLQSDCLPITEGRQEQKFSRQPRKYQGMEFRRQNRPFVRNPAKPRS